MRRQLILRKKCLRRLLNFPRNCITVIIIVLSLARHGVIFALLVENKLHRFDWELSRPESAEMRRTKKNCLSQDFDENAD